MAACAARASGQGQPDTEPTEDAVGRVHEGEARRGERRRRQPSTPHQRRFAPITRSIPGDHVAKCAVRTQKAPWRLG